MLTIAVTGANGYIGRHVVSELCDMGVNVIALDLSSNEGDLRANWMLRDILDPAFDPKKVFPLVPDVCVHLAWRNGFDHNALSHMADLSSHYLFLNKLVDYGVKRIAVMGSMHEIGYWEGAISEDTPCNPLSPYGVSKDALRRALFIDAGHKDFSLQWLRGFYIYGDDCKSQSIFGKLLRAANAGEKSFPFTTGKNRFDFTPVSVLAHMIACAVIQDEIVGIINCCSGQPVSLSDQIECFIRDNNLDIKLEYGAFPDRPYDSPAVWGNPSKINAILRQNG